ncbi:cytochrome C oxidase subunit IV family protein [Olivibacter sitiensis]|uniref:cytochrome C oxidase subunit IV family protein n=1 Tax=Olivibacter sitiensis TaxID=376470 RepID=UPI00048888BA|nr:cytochrome C oxidase subunit IV family protein [Olivibacter sitiensis]
MSSENTHHEEHGEHETMNKKTIWRVFFYLLALTCLEFFIALVLVEKGFLQRGLFVNIVYIGLTLVKAYYIVSYFMHLKFEKTAFIITTTVGFIFIAYFIVLLLVEGNYLQLHLNHQIN